MEISNDKISELLKNPEIIGMIANLASGFRQDNSMPKSAETESTALEVTASENLSEEQTISLASDKIMPAGKTALDGAFNAGHGDRRIALLEAIKPYVSSSKQSKVDGLVKAIGVAGILNTYTGAFMGNLFDKKQN